MSMLKLSFKLSQIPQVTCSTVLGLVNPNSKREYSASGSKLAFVLCNLTPTATVLHLQEHGVDLKRTAQHFEPQHLQLIQDR